MCGVWLLSTQLASVTLVTWLKEYQNCYVLINDYILILYIGLTNTKSHACVIDRNYTTVTFMVSRVNLHAWRVVNQLVVLLYIVCCLYTNFIQAFSCESTQSISCVVGNTCNIRSSKMLKESIAIKDMEPFTLTYYLPNCTSITFISQNALGILYHSVSTSGVGKSLRM